MATSYTDIIDGIILTGLETLLGAEFEEGIYISDKYENYGFRLEPTETDHLERYNAGEARIYRVAIIYYVDAPPGRDRIKHLANVFDRLNRIIGNNNVYRVSGTYKWNDANLGPTAFGPGEEGEPTGQFRTTFTCTYLEGYS